MKQENLTPGERILSESVLVDHPLLFACCHQVLHAFMEQVGFTPKFLVVGSLAFEAIAYRYLKASSFNRISNLTNAAIISSVFRESQIVVDSNAPSDHVSAVGTPMQSIQEVVARQSEHTRV